MPTKEVETIARLAHWKIRKHYRGHHKCDPFKMDMWSWHLSLEIFDDTELKLLPDLSDGMRDSPPTASFNVRLLSFDGNCTVLAHSEIRNKLFKEREVFAWRINVALPKKFIIEIEFLELNTTCLKGGGLCSMGSRFLQQVLNSATKSTLGRMLTEGINTDLTISVNNASISAHRSVLAAASPVFCAMFSRDYKENVESSIDMSDTSFEVCQALVHFLYGTITVDEFMTHRPHLLVVANKYDISGLKEACQESILDDIDTTNVLHMLKFASVHELSILKSNCMTYLAKFGKIVECKERSDAFNAFTGIAGLDLISELNSEVQNVKWK